MRRSSRIRRMGRMLRRRIRKTETAWRKLCRFLCFSAPIHWGTRVASAIRPVRAAVFSLNRRGKLRSAERGRLPRPRLGQKGRDTCGFPSSLNSYLSLISYPDANQRPATASKNRNGSRVTSACLSPPFRSSQIAYCYTGGLLSAGRGMTVPRNPLARYNGRHLRI